MATYLPTAVAIVQYQPENSFQTSAATGWRDGLRSDAGCWNRRSLAASVRGLGSPGARPRARVVPRPLGRGRRRTGIELDVDDDRSLQTFAMA